MIFTDRTIIVQKGTSSINDTIILYRGDRDIEVRFTLNEGSPFKFGSGASPNIIEKTEAAYGQLIIKTPNDLPSIFSEVEPTNEGKIVFTITAEMIDEITEVGNYTFQIRLFDESRNSRATIPEVVNGIEIREPIATEDVSDTNEVGLATVGYAVVTAEEGSSDVFDENGNYNKTTWFRGDVITSGKLNKIEAGIDAANRKAASGGTGGQGMTEEQAQQLNTAYTHSQTAHVQQSDIPTKTSDLTNDSNFVNETYVTNAINNAQLGSSGQEVDLSTYQTKTDNTLNTNDKTVVGAINEINETMVIAEEQTGDITVGEIPEGGSTPSGNVSIADDVVTSRSDMALSARQGVVLSDRINNNVREINKINNLLSGESGTAVTIDGSKLAYFIKSATNDYTDALNTLLASIPKRGKIIFPQGEEIFLGKINPIDRPIQIDFNHCKIRPAASVADQVMFELKFNGDYYDNEGRAELWDFEFMCESGDPVPQCFIQFNDAINSTVKGLFSCCKATHSLVWNLRGYGNKILGEMRRTQAPRCIYLSHDGAEDKHSFDFFIDVDISGNTGVGIEYEGGAGEMQGVVEGCEQGGIFFNGVHISKCININTVHFEANKKFDVQLGTSEFKQGSANEGWTNLTNCYFAFPPGRYEGFVPIRLGQRQRVTMFGCSVWGDGAIVAMDCTGNGNYTGNYSNLSVFGGVQTPAKIKANIGNEYVTVGGMVGGELWVNNNFQTVKVTP